MEVRTFTVSPKVPERLSRLRDLSKNLWWIWNPEAISLFRRLDPDLFSATNHNPVKMLGVIKQNRLEEVAQDEGFISHLDRVWRDFERYQTETSWYQRNVVGPTQETRIAYFSAEFGLHESFPIYSGGLGLLAGDHLKSASDLGLPLVGVGLMYQQGYFRQYLNADGWQQERYPENDFYNMACTPILDKSHQRLMIALEYPGRVVTAQLWRAMVGRVPLYLLDTNIPQNSPDDRKITAQLYGGDQDMRVRQELLLGVGGYRALVAMGEEPIVCHMNEGHSAFLALERVANIMERHGIDFKTAKELVAAGNVFTTHTPVEAGNDMFPPYLVESYLEPHLRRLKIDRGELVGLGRQRPSDSNEPFCMTVLAIRLANHCNGVSKLHGKVSRHMWRSLWPELPEESIPIDSITNGIHTLSMLCSEMRTLYDRYLGPDWIHRLENADMWSRAQTIPDAELWRIHERRRERLVAFARQRVSRQLHARGAPPSEIAVADEVLDPEALTIGFARRFATYKRGTLILRDIERLARILNDSKRPVQLIFAGKAHPKDHGGKELIAQIIHTSRRSDLRRRIVFIEDYDINVARYLVQGVDVWLNNPRRPLEASGTSGMKGPINGALNLSILDGWWCEAAGAERENGWSIGGGEEYSDLNYQDEVECRALYELLEKEVVPLFYDRGADGLPRGWIRRMKRSISTIAPQFNTNRMVAEYFQRFYLPAARRFAVLSAENVKGGLELSRWLARVESQWSNVRVIKTEAKSSGNLQVGDSVEVSASLQLGDLSPEDVAVELFQGEVDATGNIIGGIPTSMTLVRTPGEGIRFVGSLACQQSGQNGYAIRVRPQHRFVPRAFIPGLLRWG